MNITEEHTEMAERYPDMVIMGHLVGKYLVQAGVIPPRTTRCIIDIDVNGPIKIYIEKYGTASLLKVDWIKALADHGELVEYVDGPVTADASGD